jgi:uncharacterized membrane protein
LLAIGIYPLIVSSVSTFNFQILLPFGIGMLLSIATMPRLINNLYSKYGESILIFFGAIILAAGLNEMTIQWLTMQPWINL